MAKKGARVVAVAAGADAPGLRSRFVREKVVLPSPEEKPGVFSSFLLARKDLYGGIVIPTDDFYAEELARDYDVLSVHYKLAVSPNPSTDIAIDKSLTYAACQDAGIPTPKTLPIDERADVDHVCTAVGLPAILRPASSMRFHRQFDVKSFPVSSPAEVREKLPAAIASGYRMLLQEIIPGPEANVVSCKIYATDAGEILGAVAGFKLAIYPPQFGVSQVQEARRAPAVEEGSRRILEAIGFRGSLASVEWKFDERDSTWKLLEINARSVLAIALMKYVGSDIIDMLWRDKLRLPQAPPAKIRYGRRWAYIKNGLLLYHRFPEARKTLSEYLSLYKPPICFALLDFGDIKPFLYDIAPLLRRRFARKGQEVSR
jgi:predicted ATP-grasp superfamily ATP-dependent carboligase